jgi:ABC-2 type transport system ATP-binding protein
VTVVDESAGSTRLALQDGADDQAILRAALESGPVHEFTRARPSLTDLFRHIVSIEDQS